MTATAVASPYRGLAAFGESELDALLFFGREREVEVTTANLLASRLTVLYGPSGVGKTSLLRAGVARRVRELGLRRAVGRGPDLACVVVGSWADDPAGRLAAAIEGEVRPLVSPTAPAPPAEAGLADVVEHWTAVLDGELCLVLDQFEEYFVYHDGDGDPLLGQLPELVLRPGLRANVLLALRDDELARLGALKDRLPGVFANARRLERLDRDSARAAVLGPLQRHNELVDRQARREIEPELVDAVLDETAVRSQPGRVEAPYLQLVMQRVWDAEAEAGSSTLRLETLRSLGGAEAVVRDHLDEALAVLEPAEQDAAARMFEHLVTPSGTKVAHRESDLAAYAHVEQPLGHEVLSALSRERIVRSLEDAGAGARYEIFHDVLAGAVLDWGRRRELAAERELAHRRQRRLVALVAAALAAVLVMVGVTAYALVQRGDARSQARHAQASALAADALASLATDPQRGLLLADRAARREPSAAAEEVLRSALAAARGRAVLRGNDGGVLAAGFSGGGVVTVDGAGTLHRYAPASGPPRSSTPLGVRIRAAAVASAGGAVLVARRRLVEVRALVGTRRSFAFRAPAPVRAVAIDADGGRVAVATIDRRVVVRDAGGLLLAVRAPFEVASLALDARGRTLVAGGGHAARAWRVAGGRVLARVTERAVVTGVAVAPDGSSFATAGADGAARIRSLPGGALANVVVTTEPLAGVVFSPDGAAVATRSSSGVARVFGVAGGNQLAVLAGHTDAVTAAAFSPQSDSLVTGSADGTARLWDPGVAPELRVLARPGGCCVSLAAGAAGTVVVAGGRALLYRGPRLVRSVGTHVTAAVPAGAGIVTGSADGAVRDGGRLLGRLPGRVTAVAASGTTVAAAAAASVRIWSNGAPVSFRERAPVAALALDPSGTLLATGGADDVVRLRDPADGRLLRELRGHRHPVTGVAFSPDGTMLASSSVDHDVRLWHVPGGLPGPVIRAHFAVVSGVAFSPDGRWLVTAGPVTAGLFRMPAATFVAFLQGHSGRLVGVGFGADGRTVETASVDGTVRSYDCLLCGTLPELVRLADTRLASAG